MKQLHALAVFGLAISILLADVRLPQLEPRTCTIMSFVEISPADPEGHEIILVTDRVAILAFLDDGLWCSRPPRWGPRTTRLLCTWRIDERSHACLSGRGP